MPANRFTDGLLASIGYKPEALTTSQLNTESGGSHYDKNGKVRVSKKGAVGIAQVMPGTAPEAAKLAGLPWDEKRYREDPEYNLRLGDAYQKHLNSQFGGYNEYSKAAYNAGAGGVRRAIAKAKKTGGSWKDHLVPETQKYIGYKGTRNMAQNSGGGQKFIDDMQASLNISTGMDAPTEGESRRFNGDEPAILTIANGVDEAGIKRDVNAYRDYSDKFMQAVTSSIEPLVQRSHEVVAKTQAIAQTKHNIADDIGSRSTDLQTKLYPLYQRRQAILDRLSELDGMGILDRKIKKTFNSDYDPRVLRGRLENIENQMAGMQDQYDDLNKIRTGVAALSIDAEQADMSVLSAQAEDIAGTARLYKGAMEAVSGNVDAALFPLASQVRQQTLSIQAKNTILTQASAEQITQWSTLANSSPDGTHTIDGMKFSAGELQTAANNAQQQNLSLINLRNSTLAGDIHMQETLEGKALETMSADQIEEGLKNGGMYKGHQFSIDRLTQALAVRRAGNEDQVKSVVLATVPGQIHAATVNLAGNMRQYNARINEMFGNLPPEMSAMGRQITSQMAVFTQGLADARSRGVEKEYLQTQLPVFQQMQTTLDEEVSKLATRWGGGRKELTAVASSYLRGQPLNGEDAVRGLISIVRSGAPSGAKLSGPALSALKTATAIVRQFDNPAANANPNASFDTLLKGGNSKEKEAEMVRRVQQAVSATYADELTNAVFNDLPAIARNVRDEASPGKIHPFARVSRENFITAVRHGDQEGYDAVGQQVGLNGQQVRKMFAEGVDGATWQTLKQAKGLGDDAFTDLMEQASAIQQRATMEALDTFKGPDGVSPARAFLDLLKNPTARAQISNIAKNYGGSGFGAFVVSNAAGGGFNEAWDSYTQNLELSYSAMHNGNLKRAISQQRGLLADPYKRMNAVLSAMNMSQDERQLLMNASRQVTQLNADHGPEGDENSNRWGQAGLDTRLLQSRNFDKLGYVIRNHKFEDPAVERIRQKAARSWDEMNAAVDGIAESLKD